MVGKGRTVLPGPGDGCNEGSSGSREFAGARRGGAQHPSGMQQQGGAHYNPDLRQCGYQQGGRGRGYQGLGGSYHGQGRGGRQTIRGRQGGAYPGPSAPETYRPPLPKLQQATSQNPSEEASSSRPSENPTEQLQQLSLQTEPAVISSKAVVVAASSKQLRFPLRPGKGSSGSSIVVKANHFIAELSDRDFYQYDVSITPEVSSRRVNRSVINELVRMFKASYLGDRLPVYDGRKSLYTAGSLPFTSKEFQITLVDEEDGAGASARRQRNFKVVIKFAARTDLQQLKMFLAGRQADAPQEALQILDIVLRESPTAK